MLVTVVMDQQQKDALRSQRLRVRWRLFFWRQARKIVIAVTGGTVLLAGVAMLALPGPGWVTIFGGLAILATEFAWARWVLKVAKDRLAKVMEQVQSSAKNPKDSPAAKIPQEVSPLTPP